MKKQQVEIESPLPTSTALSLSAEVGLIQYDPNYYDQDKDWDEPAQAKWVDRLRLFQQMTLSGAELDVCKIFFIGFGLRTAHIKTLKIIHRHTADWVKGYMVDELLKQVSFKAGDPVAVAGMIEKLLNGPEDATVKPGTVQVSGTIKIDIDDEGLR
jgi:hypothetical protein